jgi:hypothetical protein
MGEGRLQKIARNHKTAQENIEKEEGDAAKKFEKHIYSHHGG